MDKINAKLCTKLMVHAHIWAFVLSHISGLRDFWANWAAFFCGNLGDYYLLIGFKRNLSYQPYCQILINSATFGVSESSKPHHKVDPLGVPFGSTVNSKSKF